MNKVLNSEDLHRLKLLEFRLSQAINFRDEFVSVLRAKYDAPIDKWRINNGTFELVEK